MTNKSQIRHWSNSKGEGRLFNVDLLDESVSVYVALNGFAIICFRENHILNF